MKTLKTTLRILLGLIIIVAILGAVVYVVGGLKFNETYALSAHVPAVSADSATLARGAALVNSHACSHCHGDHLAGTVYVDGMPFARVTASNLTPGRGGIGSRYTDADWERAIRHGVNADGRGLMIMPSDLFTNLADDELGAMIAYLKTLPPVDNELPGTELGPVGRMVALLNPLTMPQLMGEAPPHPKSAPDYGPTAEFGAYRASTLCGACHGSDLSGGPHPDPNGPYSPGLHHVASWTLEQFATTLRTGTRPDGRVLDDKYMPWTSLKNLPDTEIEALYRHIQALADDSET
ncbi:c-type cytochrome [Rhodocaloribacter sp.]